MLFKRSIIFIASCLFALFYAVECEAQQKVLIRTFPAELDAKVYSDTKYLGESGAAFKIDEYAKEMHICAEGYKTVSLEKEDFINKSEILVEFEKS